MSKSDESSSLIDSNLTNSENSSQVLKTKIPLRVSWDNISYSFCKGGKTFNAVKSVSGFADPGQILAILGASGSGKTSLISVLSGRLQVQKGVSISGTVSINNIDIRDLNYALISGYLPQENIFYGHMTVKEALIFAGRLKLGLALNEIKKRVKKIMEELKIDHVGDTIMGDQINRGLSGGEKKRACLACELISAPPVLIMDEPISGLDSQNAEIVVNILKNLSINGRTIIISVHQPGNLLFSKFDRVIFMQNGSFVYQGNRTGVCSYFSKIGIECPREINPAEFYIKKFHIVDTSNKTEKEKAVSKLIKKSYRENFKIDLPFKAELQTIEISPNKNLGFWFKLWVLSGRALKGFIRNPLALAFRVANTVVFAIVISLLYWDLGTDYRSVKNRAGLLQAGMLNSFFFPIFLGTFVIPIERDIMHKEYHDRLYSVEGYILSRLVIEIPMTVFFAVGLNSIAYYSANLNSTEYYKFFICMFVLLLGQVNGVMVGLIGGGLSDNVHIAPYVGTVIALPLLLFSGYFSSVNSMPKICSWMKYISPFYYGYQALLINEFSGLIIDKEVVPGPYQLFSIENNIETYIYFFLINILSSLFIGYLSIKIRAIKSSYFN